MVDFLGANPYLIVLALIVSVIIAMRIQRKASKGKFKQNVQKPGFLKTFFTRVMMLLTILMGGFTVIGSIMGEMEMAIVFSVIFIIFAILTYFMRRKFDTTYQETDDYFILRKRKEEYKVFFEDITYWDWGADSEIFILDGTKSDNEFISIRMDYFNPEFLIRTLADMTFDNKFPRREFDVYPGDSMKKKEMVQFLHWTDHKYLVKDEYIEEIGELDGMHWPEHK